MELALVYCYKDAACRGKKFSCRTQSSCHKTKPLVAGKRVLVGKVVAGVVGRVYVYEVDLFCELGQELLESGIVVGGNENVIV